jgi:hypothetical protein
MNSSISDSTLVMQAPLHGNQGDRGDETVPRKPLGPTIAISREAGARGETIAHRVGRKLGWDVYTREHLEFLSANENMRETVLQEVPTEAHDWLQHQNRRLERDGLLKFEDRDSTLTALILALAARGNAIFVGRGAGYLLPKKTTLHTRIIAPLENRIAWMTQFLRMGRTEAAEQVRKRDEMRIDFLNSHYHRRDGVQYDFDLVLNSGELGEELSADLIVLALKAKQRAFQS